MLKPCATCGTPTHSERACAHCAAPATGGTSTPLVMSAIALLGLGLNGCIAGSDDDVVALYGVPDTGFIDADGDGSRAQLDCDDENPDIYPGAPETAGDEIDSNCDGEDDT